MEFRALQVGDVERIRSRSDKEYDKLPDPEDFEESLVGIDESGEPRIVMKAQRVAEIFMAIDHTWGTPALRWALIEQAHREMRGKLEVKGYRVAYSFFADGVPNGYVRRLILLGWNRIIDRCMRFTSGGTR